MNLRELKHIFVFTLLFLITKVIICVRAQLICDQSLMFAVLHYKGIRFCRLYASQVEVTAK